MTVGYNRGEVKIGLSLPSPKVQTSTPNAGRIGEKDMKDGKE